MNRGVLSIQQLIECQKKGQLISADFDEKQFQPNSIDLRLGLKAWRVRCGFLAHHQRVEERIPDLLMYEIDLSQGAVLEKGCIYLIPLMEELDLPAHLYGRTNPKSSTGRMDIFTRVVSDYNFQFNDISAGYRGKLYLEVAPMSFAVKVKSGLSLSQLRLMSGRNLVLEDEAIQNHYQNAPLLFDDSGNRVPLDQVQLKNGLLMRVDLSNVGTNRLIGYKSKKHSAVVDLALINHYETSEFWDPVYHNGKDQLILEPEQFYIFASKEKLAIPSEICGEMVPYEPDSGELRVHYAGFFDSGFGYDTSPQQRHGAKAVLEVRPHDVPFLLEDGQVLCRIDFYHNAEVPQSLYGQDLASNYQYQGLKLSKHFKQE